MILHLGAHRTASSYFQRILDTNRELLLEEGVATLTPPYPGKRDQCPNIRDVCNNVRKRALHPNAILGVRWSLSARSTFRQLAPDKGVKMFISEENFLGPIFADDTGCGLYPAARSTLHWFKALGGKKTDRVLLTIRSYDKFIVSAYAMAALFRQDARTFDQIRRNLVDFERGWPELIADIQAIFPGVQLHVHQLDSTYPQSLLVSSLGPSIASRMSVSKEPVHVAPTSEAIAEALAYKARPGQILTANQADEIIKKHRDETRFAPLSSSERASLADRYAKDLKAIAEMPSANLAAGVA